VRKALAWAAAVVLLGAAPAAAAPVLKHVDASGYPQVELTVVSTPQAAPVVTEGGKPVAGLRAENLGRAKSVVLAVDRSQSMRGQALADATDAARSFVAAKPPADRIAVVAVGSRALRLADFSSATIDADLALRRIEIDEVMGTALFDAVVLAARSLEREAFPGRVLILLTDGQELGSTATLEQAIAAAREADVAVYPVAIESWAFSPEPLKRLARETGGTYRGTASTAELGEAYRQIAGELRRTWLVRYVTAARPGERVTVDVGGATAPLVMPGRPVEGERAEPSPLIPAVAFESGWGSLAVSAGVGLLVLIALALAAAARRGSWLQTRLAPHLEAGAGKGRRGAAEREQAFAAGAAILRATEGALSHLRWWRAVHLLLARADVPLRAVEFLYISLGSAFLLGIAAAVAGRSSLVVLGALAVGGAAPFGVLWLRARKRLKAFENQLPDLLMTLAASLKAGHSFKQGLQTVVDEGQPPASKEFKRVLAETRLGRPMEDALNEMAERVNSKNLEFVITAVTIQAQVGGSLASLFDMVADAVRQRQQFARKIRGLTAMGRASAYVLVGLPFFTAALITVINRDFMSPLYHTPTGHKLIAIGLTMMAIGSLVLRKIVSFRG
jgi:tight adherence protein B